jgi:hypothetical protein
MASWPYRFSRYLEDLGSIPPGEQVSLKDAGIAGADFLDAFATEEDCLDEVGPSAAAVWIKHRGLKGAPPDLKDKYRAILARPVKRQAPVTVAPKAKIRLYPGTLSGARLFENKPTTLSTASSSGQQPVETALDEIYAIYIATGSSGTKWLQAPEGSEEKRRRVITTPLARRFDSSQLRTQLAFLRRWVKWCGIASPPVGPFAPHALDSASFLQEHSEGRPTVALNLFNNMKWWSKYVGVPFHVEHGAVLAFGTTAPGHITVPKKPIELEAFLRLVRTARAGTGTVHLLLRACILLAVSVVRFKHANISRRVQTTSRMVTWMCPRGKRIVAGQRAPFEWAMPRFLEPSFDLAGPLLALLDQMDERSGVPLSFIVPDIAASTSAGISNVTPWVARPMPYEKWITVLQAMPSMLGFEENDAAQLWGTYTFRRLLPTIADIVGLHEGHRQALGEWVEQVAGVSKAAVRAQPLMCHRYADGKVTTAGETKLLVAAAIPYAAANVPAARSWEDLRAAGISVAKLDAYITSGTLPTESSRSAPESDPIPTSKDNIEESSSDSDESNSETTEEEVNDTTDQEIIEWFVQPGKTARVHVQKVINSEGRRIPFCRDGKPFFRYAVESGSGVTGAVSWQGGVCDTCLSRMPQGSADKILAAIVAAAGED